MYKFLYSLLLVFLLAGRISAENATEAVEDSKETEKPADAPGAGAGAPSSPATTPRADEEPATTTTKKEVLNDQAEYQRDEPKPTESKPADQPKKLADEEPTNHTAKQADEIAKPAGDQKRTPAPDLVHRGGADVEPKKAADVPTTVKNDETKEDAEVTNRMMGTTSNPHSSNPAKSKKDGKNGSNLARGSFVLFSTCVVLSKLIF